VVPYEQTTICAATAAPRTSAASTTLYDVIRGLQDMVAAPEDAFVVAVVAYLLDSGDMTIERATPAHEVCRN
jgi:hypothetical protein